MSEEIESCIRSLEKEGHLLEEKEIQHHGYKSVYDHSIAVAYLCDRLVRKHRERYRYYDLIRGALLHDYFLYDRHNKRKDIGLHGLAHPKVALENAEKDFKLSDIERDIIRHHMFPLTIVPPLTKEGWVVTFADKLCAIREYYYGRKLKLKGIMGITQG